VLLSKFSFRGDLSAWRQFAGADLLAKYRS